MTAEPSTAAARLRGAAAGLFTATLAVAAHGAAGGGLPTGTAVALLAVLAGTVGALAAGSSRAVDPRAMIGLLAAGQLVGHLMLGAHDHGMHASPGPAMVAAHLLAVAVGTILIGTVDRLCHAVSRVVAATVRRVIAPIPAQPLPVDAGADQPLRSALALAASLSHRGPPVGRAR